MALFLQVLVFVVVLIIGYMIFRRIVGVVFAVCLLVIAGGIILGFIGVAPVPFTQDLGYLVGDAYRWVGARL